MATSGLISSTMTARDVVYRALRIITVYGANDTPSAEDAQEGMEQLNWMLKSWQADGCNLWREEDAAIVIPADTPTVILDPRVIDIQEARLQRDATMQMPMQRWERGQYVTLPNKATSGYPTTFFFRRERDQAALSVWPVPTEDMTIYASIARVIEDVTDLGQNIDVPQEWNECVYYNLASRLLDVFGTVETRQVLAASIRGRAQQLYDQLSNFDRPSSVFFKPYAIQRY